ncbi:MAG: hypothetical protein C5B56_09145 [Proteobacteria bacterium]|nr:MAG: hypothetical protein C5B56_09145 [Pseudomonadota bacterium]
MDDAGRDFAEGTGEMVSEGAVNTSTELRKRRSTRIVQAVPLVVTGVDALGRPFTERTSTLIINCHGCRYQSKHYVLKNMWVSLEVPHAEAGKPPRTVRGRVAWIQRPRTVRQLFQVALELETPGNAWSIAFPPEDWFAFPEAPRAAPGISPTPEANVPIHRAPPESEIELPLDEGEAGPATGPDNLRVMPAPASATDASLQLARQVSRLLADAKQQIQAAAREAASQAVSAERRLTSEQWEQQLAAKRTEVAQEAARAIERIQQETEERARHANAAAADALRNELPRWLAPQLEQLTRELTAELLRQAASQRAEQAQRLADSEQQLRAVCRQAGESAEQLKARAEESAAKLKAEAEQATSRIAEQAETAARSFEETARQRVQLAASQHASLQDAANKIQDEIDNALETAKRWWQGHLVSVLDSAETRWQATIEDSLTAASERVSSVLSDKTETAKSHLQEEAARHAETFDNLAAKFTAANQLASAALSERTAAAKSHLQEQAEQQAQSLRDLAASRTAEVEERLAELRAAVREQAERLEAVLTRAQESIINVEHASARLESVERQALERFQSQLDDVLSLHRNELHRRSESLFEEINARILSTFEESSRAALTKFDAQIESMVQPHVARTEEALHRLAGGRSLLDAALTLQQDRIRACADEAFAESLGRFRENLGSVEQLLEETTEAVTARNLAELETKLAELRHQAIEDIFKSSEWYEKKAQTQIQSLTERAVDQAGQSLREKAGEISSVFASELDHSSRNFVGHTQTQLEEVVSESFDRARALFTEAAETTSAAFTDEIQRTARQELDGFSEEATRAANETCSAIEHTRAGLAEKTTAEQEAFLRRFQTAMSSAIEAGVAGAQQRVADSFGPLLDSWKSMTAAHQVEMRQLFAQMGEQAAEAHRQRLEGVSNQWLLATVAGLDRQSREVVSNVAASAEEKLRATCTQVFAEMGEALRERLKQIASGLDTPPLPEPRSKAQSSAGS